MFTRVAPVFAAGITRSAGFVSRRQITGISHIFASGLQTMPTKGLFARKTRQAHFARLAGCCRVFFTEGARHMFSRFTIAQVAHHPHLAFWFGNARIAVRSHCSCWFSLHHIGIGPYGTRIGVMKWHFLLLGEHRSLEGQHKKRTQNGKGDIF
jgi:hypothetical protein